MDPHLELIDEARQDEAVAERARRRVLSEAEGLDATFESSLRAAGSTGATVMLETTVGRTVRGRIEAVGEAHVVVVDASATSYVRIDQLAAVRAAGGGPGLRAAPADDRDVTPASVVGLLEEVGHERVPVDVHLVGGTVVRGTVRSVGTDVLTVSTDSSRAETLVNLSLAAVITLHRGAA